MCSVVDLRPKQTTDMPFFFCYWWLWNNIDEKQWYDVDQILKSKCLHLLKHCRTSTDKVWISRLLCQEADGKDWSSLHLPNLPEVSTKNLLVNYPLAAMTTKLGVVVWLVCETWSFWGMYTFTEPWLRLILLLAGIFCMQDYKCSFHQAEHGCILMLLLKYIFAPVLRSL